MGSNTIMVRVKIIIKGLKTNKKKKQGIDNEIGPDRARK